MLKHDISVAKMRFLKDSLFSATKQTPSACKQIAENERGPRVHGARGDRMHVIGASG